VVGSTRIGIGELNLARNDKSSRSLGKGSDQDGILSIKDWSAWHDEYEREGSELHLRKSGVQRNIAEIVTQCPPGPVTIVSICGGQCREVIGALENHQRSGDIQGRLVELDPDNAAFASAWAMQVGLENLEIFNGDASLTASYKVIPPVDVVVISGVFGHIDNADRMRLIGFTRQLLRKGGFVVWTSHSLGGGKSEEVRQHFRNFGFSEDDHVILPGKFGFTVTRSRYTGEPLPFEPDAMLFSFGSSRRDPTETAHAFSAIDNPVA
jgi:Putative methyltransferase